MQPVLFGPLSDWPWFPVLVSVKGGSAAERRNPTTQLAFGTASKAGAESVVAAISAAGGKAVAVAGDVSKTAEAEGIIDAAIKTCGHLDILVNNSGVYAFGPIETITEESFHKQFNIITPPGSAVSSGTKGAVDAITGVLSRELGAAGFIGSVFETGTVAQTPLGRLGQPGDIASIAVFLASDDSHGLTGEQLLAGGGLR